MDDIFDLIQPIGHDNAQALKEELTINEKIKKKRDLLLRYALNSNSNDSDFDKIISEYDDIPYTVNEALNLAQSNIELFPKLNELVNNFDLFYNKKIGPYVLQLAKDNNPHNHNK